MLPFTCADGTTYAVDMPEKNRAANAMLCINVDIMMNFNGFLLLMREGGT